MMKGLLISALTSLSILIALPVLANDNGDPTPGVQSAKAVIQAHFPYFTQGKLIFVSVDEQEMYVIDNNRILKTFEISSSKYGEGEQVNSMRTPLGLHFIAKKIGDDADLNTIFKARSNTGRQAIPNDERFMDKDLITTRIMWLEGGEERNSLGTNSSMKRYVYIHGTPDEALLGKPASHGCIRMKNIDVYALYEFCEEGTPTIIWKNGMEIPDVIADLPELPVEMDKKDEKKAKKRLKKEAKGRQNL